MTQIMTCYMSVLHMRQDLRIAFQKRMCLMGWEITHKLRNNMISNANTSNAPRALVAKSSWCVRIMLSEVCFQQYQCGGKIDGGHDTGERTRTKSLTFSRSPFATTWWNAATAFVLPSFLPALFIFSNEKKK